MKISKLHYITQNLPNIPHWEQAEKACLGGANWVQLRVKNMPFDEWKVVAIRTQEVCRRFNATLIINDSPLVAKEIKADGVHLGKTDTNPLQARELLGEGFIIGATANTIEDLRELHKMPINYIGCGPYRFTKTKENLSPILGLGGYQKMMAQCREEGLNLPVVGIGGVLQTDVPLLLAAGLYGIAVSSVINCGENPTEITKEFWTLLTQNTKHETLI
jgi:thiamine-phosphate pyrophosphorylase